MRGDAAGAFFGIPTAAKDFLPGVPGWPGTTGGVKALARTRKTQDTAASPRRWWTKAPSWWARRNAPSFAFRGTCDNKMFGPTSTPFKVGYNSGGSSGGSAAAVGDRHPPRRGGHRRRRLDPHSRRMVRMLRLQGIQSAPSPQP